MANKSGILTVQQQRDRTSVSAMASFGLEVHLRLLMQEIRNGDMSRVQQFQQDLRYASPELNARLLDLLDQPKDGAVS